LSTKRFKNHFRVSFIIRELLKSNQCVQTTTSKHQKMHILQPKQTKLSQKDVDELLGKLNLSKAQLPKILSSDAGLPEGCQIGDVVKIERKEEDKVNIYYGVVV